MNSLVFISFFFFKVLFTKRGSATGIGSAAPKSLTLSHFFRFGNDCFIFLPFSSDFQYNNKQKKAQNNEENFSLPRIVLDDVNPFSNLISQNGRHDEERPPSIIKDPLDVEWNC